jgi:hypothetical protein
MAIPVDFISLIKDIRGTSTDPLTGLPDNGKWFDVKDSHTKVNAAAAQVAINLAATTVVRDSATTQAAIALAAITAARDSATNSATTATTKATEANTYSGNALASQNAALASQQAAAASVVTASASVTAANSAITAAATAAASTAITVANDAATVAAAVIASTSASANLASTKATESASSAVLSANSATASATSATTSGNSATASAASASTASTAATTATTSKNAAVVAEGNALTYSTAASTSATNSGNSSIAAASSAGVATTKATEAGTQRSLAANWAIAAENIAVNDGVNPAGFSAYHWAKQAQSAVGGVTKISDLSDVPNLAGNGNTYLRVNSSATAIEFDVLTKEDVGLSFVNNTADIDKPVSSAAQTALNTKSSQADFDTAVARVTTLEDNTAGLTIQAAVALDPIRLLADKEIYTSTTQVLATLQNAALTTFGLLKAALAAETIGTY